VRLVQAGVLCDFAEEKRRYSLSDEVYKALAAEPREQRRPVPEHSVMLRFTEDKLTVIWTPALCRVILEKVSSFDDCIATILDLLQTINETAPIRELRHRRAFTHWILPTPKYDFTSLEKKYRKTMIADTVITNLAFDSSVIIDSAVNDWMLHHQSGAMTDKQLLDEHLRFKLGDLPKVFLFLEASIEDKKVVQYSGEEMRNYLTKSFELCQSHSDVFEKIWEGVI